MVNQTGLKITILIIINQNYVVQHSMKYMMLQIALLDVNFLNAGPYS